MRSYKKINKWKKLSQVSGLCAFQTSDICGNVSFSFSILGSLLFRIPPSRSERGEDGKARDPGNEWLSGCVPLWYTNTMAFIFIINKQPLLDFWMCHHDPCMTFFIMFFQSKSHNLQWVKESNTGLYKITKTETTNWIITFLYTVYNHPDTPKLDGLNHWVI